jgi:hypothetical protein
MAITVTATASGTGSANGLALCVKVLTGAASTQNGATATSALVTAPELAVTSPHATGSWVYGAVSSGVGSTAFSGTTAATQAFEENFSDTTNAAAYGLFRSAGTTTSGTSTGLLGATNPTGTAGLISIALAEILASGTLAEDASSPAVPTPTKTAKTLTTASFTPAANSILMASVSADYAGTGAVAMAVSDSGSLYNWTQLAGLTINLASVWIGVLKATSVSLPVAAVTLAAPLPTITAGATVALPAAAVTLAAPLVSPQVSVNVALPVAAVTLAAPVPTVSTGGVVSLPVATVALAAPVPTVKAGATVSLPVAALALAAPLVTPGVSVALPVATVALAAPIPTITAGAKVSLPVATLTLAAPAVTAGEVFVFDTLPTTTFPDTPLDGRVELLLAGVWTDVTQYVIGPLDNTVPVSHGHPDESTTTTPSAIPLTLDNGARAGDPAGRFTSGNPTGPWYGELVRNVPLRFSLPEGASYLRIETDQASYAQCPDSSGISITGDMDLQLDLTLDNWQQAQSLASKWAQAGGSEKTWFLQLNETGTLTFAFSPDGSSVDAATSLLPVPIPPLGRMCLRVTYAHSSGTVTFYTSPPGLSSPAWTQLGGAPTFGTSISLFNSTAPLQVGYATDNGSGLPGIFGKVHAMQLLSGIGGTAKASPDFTAQAAGTTSFTDAQGNTWTVEGTAEISDRKYRIHAETSAWPQQWDPTGHDITVQLTANGILRRLGQNAQGQVFQSALYRAYQRLTGSTAPVAYWPCEDGTAATQLASGIGGLAMQFSTAPELAGNSSFLCSNPIPTLVAGSVWNGAVAPYSGGTDNVLRFLMEVPSGGEANGAVIARMVTSGPVAYCDLVYDTAGALTLNLYNSANSLLGANGPINYGTIDGQPVRVSMELQNNGSGGISYNVAVLVPGASLAQTNSDTLASTAIGQVKQVIINPGGALTSTAIGQISVQSAWETLFDLNDTQLPDGTWTGALNAWIGEPAANRFSRLCTEEGIACRIQGNADTSVAMGPQTPEAITTLLQECADADRGQITEPRQVLGLGYRTRGSMCNQSPTVIPYSMLMYPLYPTEDDAIIQNDVTTTQNQDGSFSEQVQATGPLNIQDPANDPQGVGRYAVSVPVNLAADAQLADEAGWILHMGTVDENRYPALNVDLASTESGITSLFFDLLDLDIGDYVQVTGIPSQLPPDTIDVLVQGTTENIWIKKLALAWACIPQQPWNTLVWNDPVWGRWTTDGSTVHTSISSTATSMLVDTTNSASPLWTTAGGSFPFDILVAGERMTVTNITGTSSPQTFTVTRSVNGVVKSQAAGAAVTLFYTPVWSL